MVHDGGAGLNHGPQLVPVDQLGDGSSAVTDELRDLFDRDAGIGEHRDDHQVAVTLTPTARGWTISASVT